MADSFKEKGFFEEIFKYSPQASILFDSKVNIILKNKAADILSGNIMPTSFKELAREVVNSGLPFKKRIVYKYADGDNEKEISALIKGSIIEYEGRKYALIIIQNMAEIMRTDGVVNICSNCKKIKRSEFSWQDIEAYIKDNFANIHFSHCICPDCSEKLYKK